jgi:hypothetical protein
MIFGLRILIAISLVGCLWSSPRFRSMSRHLDEQVRVAFRRFLNAAEESGYPPEFVPVLILLTALTLLLVLAATPLALGR